MQNTRKLLLCILDGWGCSSNKEYNAIYLAKTPCIDNLQQNYPNSLIKTNGKNAGLPDGQMGNSEVGHMTIGAGRIIIQDIARINELFHAQKNLNNNQTLVKLIRNSKPDKVCHILGLISSGGVHSHIEHIIQVAKFLLNNKIKVKLHVFTDGRDTSPKSSIGYINEMLAHNLDIVSISGRYYAMDRDGRWDRIKLAYQAITAESNNRFSSVKDYVKQNYNNGITDEFITPACYEKYHGIQDEDSLLITNFRADRIKQLAEAILIEDFAYFKRKRLNISYAVGFVKYSANLSKVMDQIIERNSVKNDLGEFLSNKGCKQLRIAETEKYPHVTYFFNCGREYSMPGEDWLLIPSSKVKTYDLKPEMSAYEITDKLLYSLENNHYDFSCVNYANADMVGHTGNLDATIIACSTIDKCVTKLMKFCEKHLIDLLITADHGNAEEMKDNQGKQIKTSHTINDVPLIYFGNQDIRMKNGKLCDVAPTILDLLNIQKPKEMTGETLVIRQYK